MSSGKFGYRQSPANVVMAAVCLFLAACANQTEDRAASTDESAAKEETQSADLQSETWEFDCKKFFGSDRDRSLRKHPMDWVVALPVCTAGVGVVIAGGLYFVGSAIVTAPILVPMRIVEQELEDRESFRSHFALAKCGDASSQLSVGGDYQAGRGVSQDALEAYVWYRLATKNAREGWQSRFGNEHSGVVKAELAPEQVAEAERRIKAWKPDPVACDVQKQADGKTN